MIVAFTAHRPHKLGGYAPNPVHEAAWAAFRAELLRLRPDGAFSGMAVGGDQIAAEVCCELEIPWVAAVPFAGQERRWPRAVQERYRQLLGRARGIATICDPPTNNSEMRAAMHARDRWMVDRAGLLLALWDGSSGGTGTTIAYAREVGRETWVCRPGELIFRRLEVPR